MKANHNNENFTCEQTTVENTKKAMEKERKKRKYAFYDKLHGKVIKSLCIWLISGLFLSIVSLVGLYFKLLDINILDAMSVIYIALFAIIVVSLIGVVMIKSQYEDDMGHDFYPNLY